VPVFSATFGGDVLSLGQLNLTTFGVGLIFSAESDRCDKPLLERFIVLSVSTTL
jgi:hypothetical protein